MKSYIIIYLTIAGIFSFKSYAQQSKINDADKSYNNYAYINAIKTYERAAAKGYKSEDMLKKLGNSYYFNSDYEAAAKWYEELFAMKTAVEPEYYYRYAQSLKSTGQIEQSNKFIEEFYTKFNNDSRGLLYKDNVNYLDLIKANSGRYKVEDAGINSKFSDYSSFVFNNKIYFASARDTGNFSKRIHKWTDTYFTNLYMADIDSAKVEKFKTALNSKFNESSPVFTKDGKSVYFTRNNYNKGRKGKDDHKITYIKIYKGTLENGTWSNITELPFNSDAYSTANPALSADEKTLYFASDRPGTLGQSDIYKVSINGEGNFGTPENLGKPLNTEGRETFPYIASENEIYFASDGHPGLGGLDVFVGKIQSNGTITDIQNVGADINSPKDDFAYIIDPVSRRGYFSSNKDGGQGSDDIYKFLETKKIQCIQSLNGVITDSETGIVLPETKLSLYKNGTLLNTGISDPEGFYSFDVDCSNTYSLRVEKTDYTTKEVNVSIAQMTGKTSVLLTLNKERCKLTVGGDLGKCFDIKVIYFDLDKSEVQPQAAVDLVKILDVLNQKPTMKLDIRSYTDSRQTHQYNESLSERRVKATMNWFVKNGISPDRLTGRGYGETKLVNGCYDGVKCSEEQHQANRRSEFIITAL
ncbi:OmpA family protein [Flavobacterium sp. Root186]|uniref:OmpA family protein n=1 Tax=Flavobacterium sp. Root186 TaxID=1736485 RepID=UPI0006FE2028|nr:OmpA family protein [Flavobacterium sp. Root186]KRB59179.1 flagellar motor protein MotB [Flavobacterium sp. Root186]